MVKERAGSSPQPGTPPAKTMVSSVSFSRLAPSYICDKSGINAFARALVRGGLTRSLDHRIS